MHERRVAGRVLARPTPLQRRGTDAIQAAPGRAPLSRGEELLSGLRFVAALPAFVRAPFSLGTAREILRRRLEERERRFLHLVRAAVWEQPASPYRALLCHAGCEPGDLERLVRQDGVEGALGTLQRQGVYLTVDEFKGRRPVERGATTLAVDARRLSNPLAAGHVPVLSSGSRGPRTPVPIDLAFVRDHAIDTFLTLDTRGGVGWRHAHWGVPGGAAIVNLLEFCAGGAPPDRWFAQVDPGAGGLHPRYRWSARALRWGARLGGVRLPRPVYASLEDPEPIIRWMAGVLRAGATPHLWTYASSAVRVCQAALAAGVELRGAQFTAGGEPTTAARLALIRRAGAEAAPRYGSTETDIIAYACAAPDAPDDMHLLHDRHAVVQPGQAGAGRGLPPRALLFSSLLASAPLVLLNVSLGDQAELARRACGCPMERLGWATHLQAVRSFEKLTAGGMTFLDTDVLRVLEEVLPARFGGGPTDYQLAEQETEEGRGRLRLLVHPALGPLDEGAVVGAFLDAIGRGSGVERVMALQWREAGTVRVDRRAPLATPSGKIMHFVAGPPGAGGARRAPP